MIKTQNESEVIKKRYKGKTIPGATWIYLKICDSVENRKSEEMK